MPMSSAADPVEHAIAGRHPQQPAEGARGRVLLLSTNLGIGGGAEDQVQQLALRLRARGWTVGVVSMLRPNSLPPDFEHSGLNIGCLNMRRGIPDPRAVMTLTRVIRRFRPDVLHAHMTHANLLARAVRPFVDVPALVCTLHGSKMHSVSGGSTRWRELAHRYTDRWADVTTTICQAAADTCVADGAVPAGKVVVLPNGIDTECYAPRPEVRDRMREELGLRDEFVWLAVGRFELPKNYPLMIRAFSLALQNTRRKMTLLVCGDGSMRSRAEDTVARLGLKSQVRFLGLRRDIPAVMNAADAYVLSSDTEGLPMVLLQASASALPVVATDVGGNPEIVRHNQTGFLTPAGDTNQLAQWLLRVSSLDHFDRARLGAAGRQFTQEHFGMDRVVDRWEELYDRFLALRAPAHRAAAVEKPEFLSDMEGEVEK